MSRGNRYRKGPYWNENGERKTCYEVGCEVPIKAKGMCAKHLSAYYSKLLKDNPTPCEIEKCGRPQRASGRCTTHYKRMLEGDHSDKPIRVKKKYLRDEAGNLLPCVIHGCETDPVSRRLCFPHYHLWNTYNLTIDEIEDFDKTRVCSNEECRSDKMLRMDHDHSCCEGIKSCGKCVRGWLCHKCNAMLGFVDDKANVLQGLVRYVEKWGER